jgi:putative heme iron utilization protein
VEIMALLNTIAIRSTVKLVTRRSLRKPRDQRKPKLAEILSRLEDGDSCLHSKICEIISEAKRSFSTTSFSIVDENLLNYRIAILVKHLFDL